jgi:hypothetical protein
MDLTEDDVKSFNNTTGANMIHGDNMHNISEYMITRTKYEIFLKRELFVFLIRAYLTSSIIPILLFPTNENNEAYRTSTISYFLTISFGILSPNILVILHSSIIITYLRNFLIPSQRLSNKKASRFGLNIFYCMTMVRWIELYVRAFINYFNQEIDEDGRGKYVACIIIETIGIFSYLAIKINDRYQSNILRNILLYIGLNQNVINMSQFNTYTVDTSIHIPVDQRFERNGDRINFNREETDSLTLSNYNDGDRVVELNCGHMFDESNIRTWFETGENTCPICRENQNRPLNHENV